jgi:hypothetical protein
VAWWVIWTAGTHGATGPFWPALPPDISSTIQKCRCRRGLERDFGALRPYGKSLYSFGRLPSHTPVEDVMRTVSFSGSCASHRGGSIDAPDAGFLAGGDQVNDIKGKVI